MVSAVSSDFFWKAWWNDSQESAEKKVILRVYLSNGTHWSLLEFALANLDQSPPTETKNEEERPQMESCSFGGRIFGQVGLSRFIIVIVIVIVTATVTATTNVTTTPKVVKLP